MHAHFITKVSSSQIMLILILTLNSHVTSYNDGQEDCLNISTLIFIFNHLFVPATLENSSQFYAALKFIFEFIIFCGMIKYENYFEIS